MAPRGLHNLGASYLSLDTDGRVIRLDSFSKVQLSSMCVSCQVLVWHHHCLPAHASTTQVELDAEHYNLQFQAELGPQKVCCMLAWSASFRSTVNHVCFLSTLCTGPNLLQFLLEHPCTAAHIMLLSV